MQFIVRLMVYLTGKNKIILKTAARKKVIIKINPK